MDFLEETGFTIKQATRQDDEEFINLPTQMREFHKWYMECSKAGQCTF
jgi:hypothetical protein